MVQGLSHQPVSSDRVHTAGNDGRIYSGVADTELCRIREERGRRAAGGRGGIGLGLRRSGKEKGERKGGGRGRRGGGRSGRSERRESGREEEWGVGVLH